MSIGSVLSSIPNIGQLWSLIGVGQSVRPLIQQALSGASLDSMIRSIVSDGVVSTLETAAEGLFPKLAPELRLAAGAVSAYDHDKTKWLQQALNVILGPLDVHVHLDVDGIYGPATVAAVEQFQQTVVGLKVDGWAYRVTTPLIEAALAKVLAKAPSVATEQVAVTTPAQIAS